MLWQLLCGTRPFADDDAEGNWHATLDRMIDVRRRGITQKIAAGLPADCPPTLQRVLTRCLAPDPAERWQTGNELAQQLEVCLDPLARGLIDPVEGRNVRWQRRFAVPILILIVLLPNVVAAVYNHNFNWRLIHEDDDERVQRAIPAFHDAVWYINGIAFPLGISLGVWLSHYAASPVQVLVRGGSSAGASSARRRSACLRLGERASWVCLGLWVVAGICYPVVLHLAAGGLPGRYFATFIGSLAICGMIATAYPFFLVTYFAVRRLYPVYLQHGRCGPEDAANVQRLDQRLPVYLVVAACVPLVAIAGLSLAAQVGGKLEARVMFWVCVGGMAALAATYRWCYQPLQKDLTALLRTLTPDKDQRRE
jgi:hypothetical protein